MTGRRRQWCIRSAAALTIGLLSCSGTKDTDAGGTALAGEERRLPETNQATGTLEAFLQAVGQQGLTGEGRDQYLARERLLLDASLRELDRRGTIVIPTPKHVRFAGDDVYVNSEDVQNMVAIAADGDSAIAVQWLRSQFRTLGSAAARPLVGPDGSAPGKEREVLIRLSGKDAEAPGTAQGYHITTSKQDDGVVYRLGGHDPDGLLYAAVTFCQLLQKDAEAIGFPHVEVRDWPDIRLRCVGYLGRAFAGRFYSAESRDAGDAKRYVDWALAHKINILEGPIRDSGGGAKGDPRLFDSAMRGWLREVHQYARERGIRSVLDQNWYVGVEKLDANDPAMARCVRSDGGRYCWSRDDLLARKIERLNEFLAETGYSVVFFHCLEEAYERWGARCDACKARFGDDRMKGDANVISHFHRGLKKANPDIMPVFVLRPYWGNLLLGRNLNPFSGGDPEIPVEDLEVRPGDMSRLSAMIPEDALICIRETDRDSYLSWKAVLKRPLYVYQASDHFWEGLRGTVGKTFPNTFRYAQAYANPLGEDAVYYCEHDASKDIADLGAAEYTWNLNAPGAGRWDVYLRDLWDPFGEQRDRNPELQALLQRACRDLYGAAEGPLLYNTFIALIDAKFVFDTRSFEFPSAMAARAGIPCSKKDAVKSMQRMHEDATAAIRDLERLLEQGTERRDTEEAVTYFLAKLYPVRAGAHVLCLGMAAQEAASEKQSDRSRRLLTQARRTLAEEEGKLKAVWARLAGRASLGGRVARQAPSLVKIEEELGRISVEVQNADPEARVKPSS